MQGCKLDSWLGSKDPTCLTAKNQNIEWKQCYGKFNKDLLNGLHQKKKNIKEKKETIVTWQGPTKHQHLPRSVSPRTNFVILNHRPVNPVQSNKMQHNTAQHNTIQSNKHNTTSSLQHSTTQCNPTQCNTAQHSTSNPIQQNTIQHNTTQPSATQHNPIQQA